MDGQKAAGSVFMCRRCNLFSPSHSQLLAHCSQLHPEQEPPDHLITVLQPLEAESGDKPADGPVKRKRGRPKGSPNKKLKDLTTGKVPSAHTPADESEIETNKKNVEGEQQGGPAEGKSRAGTSRLECKKCHRMFSNGRQILKHICKREDDEEEDEEDGSTCREEDADGSQIQDQGGGDSNKTTHNSKARHTRQKEVMRTGLRARRRCISKEASKATEIKKTVVNVVLTEDKNLPGVSKMVPVEEDSAEAAAAAQHSAVSQNESQDPPGEASTCEGKPKTDQDPSSNLAATTTTNSQGFQEYSIKQDASNLPPSELKIFTCEFCNKIFKFRHSLMAHLRMHTQEKPFHCPHCEYTSAIKSNLKVHLRKHTGEKFSCEQCPFNCLSLGHLKVHVERVHMKVKQHCSFCEKKYCDVKNLLQHMELQHDLKDPAVHQTYQQLRLKTRQGLRQLLYHCPTCNRHFKNQLVRERHMFIHGPQRPFACLLCDHAATNMVALAAHVRKHLFMYVCCVCGEKSVSSQRLKSHLKDSHPELDQLQAFTDSINCSCHLNQEGGSARATEEAEAVATGVPQEGEEEKAKAEVGRSGAVEEEAERASGGEQVEEGQVESREGSVEGEELKGAAGRERLPNEEGRDGAAGDQAMDSCAAAHKEDARTSLTESTHTPVSEERTVENTHAAAETPASNNNHSSSSARNSNQSEEARSSPGAPTDGNQNPHPEKESEVVHQTAFQQVFSSLHKTPLNIETFYQLRRIYGDLECQYCGKLFWYKVHYNVHVRTHTKEHLHYCSKCNYSSITKSSLKRHQIQKHSDLLLSCSHPECKYTTPDKYKLQIHQETQHEKRRSATCPVCQKTYSKHWLKNHIKTAHPDALPAQGKGLMAQRAEQCPYCDSYFLKNSSDFQQHIWAHQGLKPYSCSICDYAGRSKSNLKTHMNRHNTEKPHLCDLCGKKFKSKFTLKSHRLSHTDEGKRFQCSECDYSAAFKPALLRHMEQHAEFKAFRCAHCHYSCNVAGALKRHYKVKHPDQIYENAGAGTVNPEALKQQDGVKCPECDFVYGTKWELNRHLKSKHCLKVMDGSWEVGEEVEAQYVTVEDEDRQTEAPLVPLQDSVNIQQITEFNSETQEAVTSMVAMAPGTVTVVQQLQVAEEQEVDACTNQLMVLDANGALNSDQVMVVEEAGLEALTVLTQGDDAHHYIVYVQEHTVEIN